MTAHKHAALMLLFAQDAAETEQPWELWEVLNQGAFTWRGCDRSPRWDWHSDYRRKPRTIRIGEFDVPEPFRGELTGDQEYWTPAIDRVNGFMADARHNSTQSTGRMHIARGLVHLTKEAAELHAQALISLTKVAS